MFDEIQIVPTADNPQLETIIHKMTQADRDKGYVDFEGLSSNGSYIIYGQNNNVSRYFDRQYNKVMMRMMGEPGEPIIIPATVDPNDTILAQRYVPGCRLRVSTPCSPTTWVTTRWPRDRCSTSKAARTTTSRPTSN